MAKLLKTVGDSCSRIIDQNEGITIRGNIFTISEEPKELIDTNIDTYGNDAIEELNSIDLCAECFLKRMPNIFQDKCRDYLAPRIRDDLFPTIKPISPPPFKKGE